tara:strand:- start:283 stop:501 length:219 start_codon:yes stop_codon:yes gene_type:complete
MWALFIIFLDSNYEPIQFEKIINYETNEECEFRRNRLAATNYDAPSQAYNHGRKEEYTVPLHYACIFGAIER